MSSVFFSKKYLKALNEFSYFVSTILPKENKHALMFVPENYPDYVVITKLDLQTIVSISANNEHVKIPKNEIGFSNLPEFVKFLNSLSNNSQYETKINMIDHETQDGKKKTYLHLTNNKTSYHIALGKQTLFDNEYDRCLPTLPENDVTALIAKIFLSKNDLKDILNNVKLLGFPENFAIKIKNNKIYIYIKDSAGERQYTKIIDEQNVLFESNYYGFSSNICLFDTKYLLALDCFSTDYIILLRHVSDENIILLKSYSYLNYENEYEKLSKKSKKAPEPENSLILDLDYSQNLNYQKHQQQQQKQNPIGLFIGATQSPKEIGFDEFNLIE